MFSIFHPGLWLAFLLACAISGAAGFFKGNDYGKSAIKAEWSASVAQANIEARQMEQRRQSNVDQAARAAGARAAGIRADSARAGDALERLRGAVAAKHRADESAAAANHRADALGILLVESGEALREMALSCDRIVSDRQMLLDAWPR